MNFLTYINSENMYNESKITRKEADFIDLIDQCYDDTPVTIMSSKEEKNSYYKQAIEEAVKLYEEIPNE